MQPEGNLKASVENGGQGVVISVIGCALINQTPGVRCFIYDCYYTTEHFQCLPSPAPLPFMFPLTHFSFFHTLHLLSQAIFVPNQMSSSIDPSPDSPYCPASSPVSHSPIPPHLLTPRPFHSPNSTLDHLSSRVLLFHLLLIFLFR